MRHVLASVFILVLLSTSAYAQRGRGGAGVPADGGPNGLGALHFRPVGPEGNRVASITGVPGDAMTVYTGAADGGIWKTTDAGITWRADLRRQGRLRDRRARRCAVRARYCVGRHGRALAHSPVLHARRRRLQIDGRGPHLAAHGARRDRTYRAHRDRSERRQQRVRLRHRPGVPSAARARRVPHDRRRRDVDAGAGGEREHRLLRPRDGSEAIRRRCTRACGS